MIIFHKQIKFTKIKNHSMTSIFYKKIKYSNCRVVRKKNSERNKKTITPHPLQVKWSVPKLNQESFYDLHLFLGLRNTVDINSLSEWDTYSTTPLSINFDISLSSIKPSEWFNLGTNHLTCRGWVVDSA
jgi:hypothetical protein